MALLRHSQTGPYVYPVVPPEFTNWRDEQRAWQETCVLFNQSFHMTDMYVEGPDAFRLLSELGVNSFKDFGPNKAKQFVACNADGYVIGDVVLFHLEEERFNLVGRASVHNWVRYHCETGGYDATTELDERSVARQGPIVRRSYRYQVQGPNALDVVGKATGAAVPNVRFFHMTVLRIAGRDVRASEGRGMIIGGKIYADRAIEVKVAGSPNNVRGELRVGGKVDKEVYEQLLFAEKDLENLNKLYAGLRKDIEFIELLKKKLPKFPEKKIKELKELILKLKKVEEQVQQATKRRDEIQKQLGSDITEDQKRISVNTLHRGVIVGIDQNKLLAEYTYKLVLVQSKDGEMKINYKSRYV